MMYLSIRPFVRLFTACLPLLLGLNACTSLQSILRPTPESISNEEPTTIASPTPLVLRRPAIPQIGLNFIPFYGSDEKGGKLDTLSTQYQPGIIFKDFLSLGVHAYSAPSTANLLWSLVEPRDNEWNFTAADAVLMNPEFEPVVMLFDRQFSSPNPPWQKNPVRYQKELGPEAQDYIRTVVTRYARFVRYYELGSEMDARRSAIPSYDPTIGDPIAPPFLSEDGFTPQEQGRFLAQAAALVRQCDPDAVIILPSLSKLDWESYRWLEGVIEGGGKDWFDIIGYHYYSTWEQYDRDRSDFQEFLYQAELDQKAVWLTETGSTASETLTIWTKYPNSEETQAADITRRVVSAYGHGDEFVAWHTYFSLPERNQTAWQMFGLRNELGEPTPAYYAFRLIAYELLPFAKVDLLSAQPRGVNAYRILLRSGRVKYVVWGRGTFTIPAEMSQQTVMIPLSYGQLDWQAAKPGWTVRLSPYPVLLK